MTRKRNYLGQNFQMVYAVRIQGIVPCMVFASVTNVPLSAIGLNQQIYQRLKLSLGLNLRRQIFIAVCDDLNLRDRLAAQLQSEIGQSTNNNASGQAYPRLVSLQLSLEDPNPLMQIAQWLTQSPPPYTEGQRLPMPAFQIVGVEHLTRQSPAVQRLFFTHLQTIERNLPLLDFSLLIWMTQPWFHAIAHSAPEFWRCRTGVFEFAGDPTPVIMTMPERFQTQSSGGVSGSTLADSTAASDSDSTLIPSHDLPLDPVTEALLDKNPWMLLEDEFEQLYESDQPSIAANSAFTKSNSLVDNQEDNLTNDLVNHLTGDLIREPGQDQIDTQIDAQVSDQIDAQINTQINEQIDHQDHQIDASSQPEAIAPLTLDLPDDLSDQPQLQLLLQQVARLHEQQASLSTLGEAYRTLGNFFRDRIEQGAATSQYLVVAIQIYEQALQLFSNTSPTSVDVLNDLGNLYWMLSRTLPSHAESLACLQQGVESYQQALTRIDPAHKAHIYPMVQNNLGAAYADLARYQEPVTNLERSVQSYQQALRYRKPQTDPLRYASTQNNLGTTYWNLAQHKEPAENLKQAIVAYSEALRYYDPNQEPMNYAMIQNNLGTAYWNMSQHQRPHNWLKLAVAAYESALQYRTMNSAPLSYAATQNNLGTAYWHIANQTEDPTEQLTYLQKAIAAYEAALQATETLQKHQPNQPLALNFDQFSTHNNLGIAYYQIATGSAPSLNTTTQSQCLQAALFHHVEAEQGWHSKDHLRQTAISCIIQTIRATYNQLGLSGQSAALSSVPGHLLPEILPKL
jgi:tetratricopeptide (TPR) repeat protein